MKHFKRSVYVVLLMGIVLAAVYFIPLRRDIDMSMPCVIWEPDDPSEGELEGIEIKGKYYDYLIKDDRFKGTVCISEINDDVEEDLLEMEYDFNTSLGFQHSTLYYFSREKMKTVFIGSLYTHGIFDKVLISLHIDNDSPLRGKYLTAPATNMEEAVTVAEAMNFHVG